MYEESMCCAGERNFQFVDKVKWLAHCLVCKNKYCVVCVAALQNVNSFKKSQRLTLAQCQCVRCPLCDSANTVNRDATKSYYCYVCAKNFCWHCHQIINRCICFKTKSNIEEDGGQKDLEIKKKKSHSKKLLKSSILSSG